MKAINEIHLGAQYLAAAGISFVEKQADDSHTNLAWDTDNQRLVSRKFGTKKSQLALSFNPFSLEWLNNGELVANVTLENKTHAELLNWIVNEARENVVGKEYTYAFHYELPYEVITDDFAFGQPITSESTVLSEALSLAQGVFEKFLATNNLTSEIRVWPHHFDLGIYTELSSEKNLFIGAGLAIPDTMIDELYFYASGYKGGEAVVTKAFDGLSEGKWHSDWEGATLVANGRSTTEAELFLSEVCVTFRDEV